MEKDRKEAMEPKVYLFPLQHTLSLPRVGLPFHIFEPRYRRMVNDAVEEERPIAVLPQRSDQDYRGKVFSAGVPQVVQRYEDGRMDIVLVGEIKGRLSQPKEGGRPYLVYGYEPLEEDTRLSSVSALAREGLRAALTGWARQHIMGEAQLEAFCQVIADDETMMGYATLFLVSDVSTRVKVLEEPRWEKKALMLWHCWGPKDIALGPFLAPLKWE